MLHARADGLWTYEMPHSNFGFQLGARMTIVRASTGALTIVSPVRIDDAIRDEILKLGPVKYIVAPNLMHYKYVADAKRLFPKALVLAAPDLREKIYGLPVDAVLGRSPENDRALELEQHAVQGMPMFGEIALFDARTKTLILTDTIANFPRHEHWWSRTYLKLSRAYGHAGQTILLKIITTDRVALNHSRDIMLQWDFDRIIVAHGDVIETGGKQALMTALP